MKKPSLIVLICLLFFCSCKKKEADPAPAQPDELIYTTAFNDTSWPTRANNKYTSTYDAETFKLSIDTINWFGYEIAPITSLNTTYSIEVDVKITLDDPSQLGYAGFIYNYINPQSYSIMNICTNGTFFAYKVTEGVGSQLFYTTVSSDLIKGSGQLNTIKIKQRLHSQEFILNGVSQGEFPFQIETQPVHVGLTAVMYPNFYTVTKATFDNFTIKKIH